MLPILDRLFSSQNKKATKTFDDAKKLTTLQNEIAERKKELDSIEYGMLLEKKHEVFISLKDFLDLIELEDMSMDTILRCCKHISELDKKSSVVEMYSIVEDNHVVLCSDVKRCEKHKASSVSKIRIATIRGVRE